MSIDDVAMRRLSARSRSTFELKTYLSGKGYEEDKINDLIERFVDYGYLDDGRFCNEFITYGYAKSWGNRRIISELKKRGIDPETTRTAIEEREEPHDEFFAAFCEAERTMRNAGDPSEAAAFEKILGRIARRLASLGYGNDVIYRVIGEIKRKQREI